MIALDEPRQIADGGMVEHHGRPQVEAQDAVEARNDLTAQD